MKTISQAQLNSMKKSGALKPTRDTVKLTQDKKIIKALTDATKAFEGTSKSVDGGLNKVHDSIVKLANAIPIHVKREWSFTIQRDYNGLIKSINAEEV